jgi:glycosyltransferase involved in cell wall biosynthesis
MSTLKNILTINTANAGGGAETIAYNLCHELYNRGYNSKLLVGRADASSDPDAGRIVARVPGEKIWYEAGNFFDDVFSTQYLFYLPTWKIPLMEEVQQADVLHFHNMHGYYFNQLVLPWLMWQKPVVWTLHDMWPFTGKCSHAYDCERFTRWCGKCPQLAAYPRLRRDTTRFHLLLKKLLIAPRQFVIVSPSEWLRNHIERSIFKDKPVYVIPSPIETRIFYPEPKTVARARLQIPENKKVLLFVASWVNSIPSKGLCAFKEMLKELYSRHDDLYTLIVGHLEGQPVLGNGFIGKETGWINDPNLMRSCYSAADIFVSPTMAENSSCTIVEAMACGTPTVAYASGGVPEQIVHKETGYLIPTGDQRSLIESVETLLAHLDDQKRMGHAAAERAKNNYSMELFVEKYLRVYREAIAVKNRDRCQAIDIPVSLFPQSNRFKQ